MLLMKLAALLGRGADGINGLMGTKGMGVNQVLHPGQPIISPQRSIFSQCDLKTVLHSA
jgi:hypothetical protein